MKINVVNLKMPLSFNMDEVRGRVKSIVKCTGQFSVRLIKKSLDARKKDIHYNLTVAVEFSDTAKYDKRMVEEREIEIYNPKKARKSKTIAVIGAGPCGLFCALSLAESGLTPIVFERGSDIDERAKRVDGFFSGGVLDEDTNIQFGEGGAGAFSDGKLNTGTKNPRQEYVFRRLVEAGAPECILYDAHPHVGTDKLRIAVKGLRDRILSLGGQFLYNTKVDEFITRDGKITAIGYVSGGIRSRMDVDEVVLAIGHSARDTYEILSKKTPFERKPFSVGVRVEHLREAVNASQFGRDIGIPAEYKLSHKAKNGRGVYTFCMCPGGVVVPSSSEHGGVVTNGMSYFARSCENSNSAILVSVTPDDFGEGGVLKGVEYQRNLEKLAFSLSGDYKAPCQKVSDFLENKKTSEFGSVTPSYSRGVVGANLREILPSYVSEGLGEGIRAFGDRAEFFRDGDAVLTGVETRSSAPVRILRDDTGEAIGIKGLYPAGEGAGYAGGITSASVDGVSVAEKIIDKLNSEI